MPRGRPIQTPMNHRGPATVTLSINTSDDSFEGSLTIPLFASDAIVKATIGAWLLMLQEAIDMIPKKEEEE